MNTCNDKFVSLKIMNNYEELKMKRAFTLTEDAAYADICADKPKYAFTLAEVLITLGIIGIIAAMTLPALISKHIKKQTAIQVKKAYSEITQLINRSIVDNEEIKYWDLNLSGKDFYIRYLKPYVIGISEVPNSEFKKHMTYKNLNGTPCTSEVWCTQGNSYYVFLADGVVMGIMTHGNNPNMRYKAITIDINGYKQPNQIGKDVFIFAISKSKNTLVPYGISDTGLNNGVFGNSYDRNAIKSDKEYGCNKNKKGIWCAALLFTDNWEFKDDYPW